MLRPSFVAPRCEICGVTFDLRRGGACSVCHRLVCGRHVRKIRIDDVEVVRCSEHSNSQSLLDRSEG